jgi:hypothetical protein
MVMPSPGVRMMTPLGDVRTNSWNAVHKVEAV